MEGIKNMIRMNENYLKLNSSYLFSEIAKRVDAFQNQNPSKEIIRLGIGDVTSALPKACIEAFHKGVEDMANDATFKGYGPEQGYEFLREKSPDSIFRLAMPILKQMKCSSAMVPNVIPVIFRNSSQKISLSPSPIRYIQSM
jgi:hypothetical protein